MCYIKIDSEFENARKMSGCIIEIEGKIATGKTTLIKSLYDHFIQRGQSVSMFEEQILPSFLDLYLSDIRKYAWSFQAIILHKRLSRYQQAIEEAKAGKIVLMDRSVTGDRAFAKMQHNSGYFTDQEYQVYLDLTPVHLDQDIPIKTIYLECSAETSMKRLKIRGNPSEIQVYSLEYMNNLETAYRQTLPHRTIFVPWEQDDPKVSPESLNLILRLCKFFFIK